MAVEDCVGNHVLHIEITCCVPFLKNYKPVTEVVSVKLQ
jgi:hypothetical protein